MEIQEQKKVWVAWANTDNTEGRGWGYPLYVCESRETARRLGKGQYVQGSDCPVREGVAVKVDGTWLVPGRIVLESKEDKKQRERREQKQAVLAKARQAGLTDEELSLLS